MPEDERTPAADHLRVLAGGEVELVGRMPYSSNRTYLVTCTLDDVQMAAVYKPRRGERQLWDFEPGIWRREVAAYELSAAAGFGVVPETVAVRRAPMGEGSLQRFVPSHFEEHYFTLLEDETHAERLRTICAFDIVANNADRKGGHVLLGEDGTLWAIDNALCFHAAPKLRTVMWDFAGEPIGDRTAALLGRLAEELPESLAGLLGRDELVALRRRVGALLDAGRFPDPEEGWRHYPWPLV